MPTPTSPKTNTTGWFMLFATSTGVDTTSIAQGIYVESTAGILERTIPIRQGGWRGMEIMPFGSNADTVTFTIGIQHLNYIYDWAPYVDGANQWDFAHNKAAKGTENDGTPLVRQIIVRDMATLTCTLTVDAAPNIGVAGAYLLAADQLCDTISASSVTFQTQLESAWGQSAVLYSPTSNVPGASYWIPDLGNPDYIRLNFIAAGGGGATATTMNALIKLDI